MHKIYASAQAVLVVRNPPANAGDVRDAGVIPGLGKTPGEESGNPLQYPCLDNSMDRGAWWAMLHRVAKSWAWLKRFSMHACMHYQRAVSSFFPYILDTVWRLSKFSPFICLGRTHKIIGWMGKPLPNEDWVQGKEVVVARTSWLEVPGSQELGETSHHLMETKEHRPLNSESARIKRHSRCPFSEGKTEEDNEMTFGRKLFPQRKWVM